MAPLSIFALTAGVLASATHAQGFVKFDVPSLKNDWVRGPPGQPGLEERDPLNVPYANKAGPIWLVQLSLGTPPQTIMSQLDTGSQILVVETSSSDYCTANPAKCQVYGVYDAAKSSTYQYVDSGVNITYGDKTTTTGDNVRDNIIVGGVTTPNFDFGIMKKTTVTESVFGVSFQEEGKPDNYPQALARAGVIQSNAYGIWMNDVASTGGEVTFGGVDIAKYTGSLSTLNLVPGGSVNQPALLGTGTTTVDLPATLLSSIITALGGQVMDGTPYVPCSLRTGGGTLDFNFGAKTINVKYDQIIYPGGDGQTSCQLGIGDAATTGNVILGDFFLTSAYIVYDLDNKQVAIAQAFNTQDSCVVPIGSGANAVPKYTGGAPCPTSGTSSTTSSSTQSSPTTMDDVESSSTTTDAAETTTTESADSFTTTVDESSSTASIDATSTTVSSDATTTSGAIETTSTTDSSETASSSAPSAGTITTDTGDATSTTNAEDATSTTNAGEISSTSIASESTSTLGSAESTTTTAASGASTSNGAGNTSIPGDVSATIAVPTTSTIPSASATATSAAKIQANQAFILQALGANNGVPDGAVGALQTTNYFVFALNQAPSTMYLDDTGRFVDRASGHIAAVSTIGRSSKRQTQSGALISFVRPDRLFGGDVAACECSFGDGNILGCDCNSLRGLVMSQAGVLGVGNLDGFSIFSPQGLVGNLLTTSTSAADSDTFIGTGETASSTGGITSAATLQPTTTTDGFVSGATLQPTTTTKKQPKPTCHTNNPCYKTIKSHWKKGNKFCKSYIKHHGKAPPQFAWKACHQNRKKISSACKCLPKATPKPAPYRPPPSYYG